VAVARDNANRIVAALRHCAPRAIAYRVGDEQIPVIGLDDLKANKAASGRNKDLDDLENLP